MKLDPIEKGLEKRSKKKIGCEDEMMEVNKNFLRTGIKILT